MADYAITFARSARKELEDLPADIAGRVLGRIEVLAGNPRPPGVIKLRGSRKLWRLRGGASSAGRLSKFVRSLVPREAPEARAARLKKIIAALERTYPDAHCELNCTNPLELLVATILSAQCTDKRVNLVTAELFKKYRAAADYANASTAGFEREIKSTGFYRNKAKSIQACCRKLVERHGGAVPQTMEELIQLDGVGRKTANVVLGNAFGVNVGVVVDTHVTRLSQRLGLTNKNGPEKIELALMKLVPQAQWTMFSHWLIWHGRRRCAARKLDCGSCEIRKLCPRLGVEEITAKTRRIQKKPSR